MVRDRDNTNVHRKTSFGEEGCILWRAPSRCLMLLVIDLARPRRLDFSLGWAKRLPLPIVDDGPPLGSEEIAVKAIKFRGQTI